MALLLLSVMSSTPGLYSWLAFMLGEQVTMEKCHTDKKISGRFDIFSHISMESIEQTQQEFKYAVPIKA